MPSDAAFKSFCHEENSLSKGMVKKLNELLPRLKINKAIIPLPLVRHEVIITSY